MKYNVVVQKQLFKQSNNNFCGKDLMLVVIGKLLNYFINIEYSYIEYRIQLIDKFYQHVILLCGFGCKDTTKKLDKSGV